MNRTDALLALLAVSLLATAIAAAFTPVTAFLPAGAGTLLTGLALFSQYFSPVA